MTRKESKEVHFGLLSQEWVPNREVSWTQSPPSLPQRIPAEHLSAATAYLQGTLLALPAYPAAPAALGSWECGPRLQERRGQPFLDAAQRSPAGPGNQGADAGCCRLCSALRPALANLRSSPLSQHDLRRRPA